VHLVGFIIRTIPLVIIGRLYVVRETFVNSGSYERIWIILVPGPVLEFYGHFKSVSV